MNRLQIFFTILFTSLIITNLQAQEAQFPIVEGFGGIYEIPGSVNPDPNDEYKIVIDLLTAQPDTDQLNPGLNNVARMMNLHVLGGVDPEKLSIKVAIHGGATQTILNNGAYRKRHGTDNPNIDLIDALKAAGVEVYVCGQSLIGRDIEIEEVNNEVIIGLSMLTVVTTAMNNGYDLLVFD